MDYNATKERSFADGKAALALAGAAFLWSTGGIGIKLVDLSPMAITGARSAIAALVLFAVLGRRLRFTWSGVQIGAALAYALLLTSNVVATKLTTAANAILLAYAAPLYVALFAPRLLGEKTRPGDWVFILATLGGMVLFFLDRLTPGGMWGNLIAVGTGLFYAAFTLCMRAQQNASPLESVILGHILTALAGLPFLFIGPTPGAEAIFGLAYLGVVQQGLSLLLYVYGVKRLGALQTILVMTLEPVLNPVWVALFYGEIPGPWAILGGTVVLAAVTLRSVISAAPAQRARRLAKGK
jgi:drug/metabolite transporter (DMT)-like permease